MTATQKLELIGMLVNEVEGKIARNEDTVITYIRLIAELQDILHRDLEYERRGGDDLRGPRPSAAERQEPQA